MGWTDWRKMAEGSDRRAAAAVGHDGAATYELALRRTGGGDMTIVYVGETENERARIVDYVRGTTPLESLIADALQKGFALHYRSTAQPTVAAARAFRDAMLMKYGYSWNKLGS